MATLRLLVSSTSPDVISGRNIRLVEVESVVNLWASSVTVTDTMGLNLGKIALMDQGTMNVRAAALGLVVVGDDQLLFNLVVGPGAGDLQIPVDVLNTSLIFVLSVEPILA